MTKASWRQDCSCET